MGLRPSVRQYPVRHQTWYRLFPLPAWLLPSKSKHKKAAEKFVAYMTTPAAMQKYYDVDGSPVAVKGVKQKGFDSQLGGLSSLAFTKHDMVWLA